MTDTIMLIAAAGTAETTGWDVYHAWFGESVALLLGAALVLGTIKLGIVLFE